MTERLRLRATTVAGITQIDESHGFARSVCNPLRARFTPPMAAVLRIIIAERHRLYITDGWRSPQGSLTAHHDKPKLAQPPGKSPHNVFEALDESTHVQLREFFGEPATKKQIDEYFLAYDIVCFRTAKLRDGSIVQDHALDNEEWHFGFDLLPFMEADDHSTARAFERKMAHDYGDRLQPDDDAVRAALTRLGHLRDGVAEHNAIMAFQSRWGLDIDGDVGPITRRTLAVIDAEIVEVAP